MNGCGTFDQLCQEAQLSRGTQSGEELKRAVPFCDLMVGVCSPLMVL